jgi:hypothetical protein
MAALRTLRCMEAMVSAVLLVAAFALIVMTAVMVAARLYRGSRPADGAGRAQGPSDG